MLVGKKFSFFNKKLHRRL